MKTCAFWIAAIVVAVTGCSATRHRADVAETTVDRITVGTVQNEIRVGMDAASVAEALGSPNIVSTDAERREVWIYDKFSSEVAYSRSDGMILGLIVGGTGGGAGSGGKSAGARSSSQRTMTVIIKFDLEHRVRDFAYRTSSF